MRYEESEETIVTAKDVAEAAYETLLPEKGADFEIQYHAGEIPVVYGEEQHTWVNAKSAGLRVVCMGPEFRVSMARQRKPLVPEFLMGEDGAYRRALRIAIGGDEVGNNADYYIHIMGDLVLVTTDKVRVAQMVNDESLTKKDRALLEELRERAEEAEKKVG